MVKPQIIAPANGAGAESTPVTDEIIIKENAVKAITYEFKRDNNEGQVWVDLLPPKSYNDSNLLQSNIPVGQKPSVGSQSFSYAYFDLGIVSAMTFGRITPETRDSQAKLWGTNDPTDKNSWQFIGYGNPTDGMRRVTGYGYRYYCYTAHYLDQDTLMTMQTGSHFAVASSIEALTFKTDKDLALLNVSTTLTDNDTGATGEITAIDVASKTVTLDSITGTFNIGDTCTGQSVKDPNAPDPSGVNFVGSTFASTKMARWLQVLLIGRSQHWQTIDNAKKYLNLSGQASLRCHRTHRMMDSYTPTRR